MDELEEPGPAVTILALDVATSCGVTDWTLGQKPSIYTKNFGKDDLTGLDWLPRVSKKALRWINQRLADKTLKPVTHVIIEAPIQGGFARTGADATALKWVTLGCLSGSIALRGKPLYYGNVSTVRKHFINHGKPDNPKPKVFRMCNDMGIWPDNHDESDSFALAHYLACELGYRHLVPDNRKHFRSY